MNKFKFTKWVLPAGLVLLLVMSGTALASGGYTIDWWSVDGGGGAAGGDYDLNGAIGQADAGQISGGGFEISGGFWSGWPIEGSAPPQSIYLPLVIR